MRLFEDTPPLVNVNQTKIDYDVVNIFMGDYQLSKNILRIKRFYSSYRFILIEDYRCQGAVLTNIFVFIFQGFRSIKIRKLQ